MRAVGSPLQGLRDMWMCVWVVPSGIEGRVDERGSSLQGLRVAGWKWAILPHALVMLKLDAICNLCDYY